jgi:adenosine kinase
MSEARNIELRPVAERVGGLDLVLIGANDPEAMIRHTVECRQRGLRFAADPSQQLARMTGEQTRQLIDGAAFLFTNEYERTLLEAKTGYTEGDLLDRVEVRVTTLGKDGVEIVGRQLGRLHVKCATEASKADPTGVGDAFRAGFLTALSWGLGLERAAEVGNLLATYVLETIGTQEYSVDAAEFVKRLGLDYGDRAAEEVASHIAK